MKQQPRFIMMSIILLLACMLVPFGPGANAQEKLEYACSAQVYEAFGMERLAAFQKQTGVEVDLYISSSRTAIYRLMNGFSDLASSTTPLYFRDQESGYVQKAFCKDPLAIIVNEKCPISNLKKSQIQAIFSKSLTNWKDFGGPNQEIMVIVPGKDTAAYKNFEDLAMNGKEIRHDYMSYQSTKVIEAVRNIPWSISFIAQGAVYNVTNIKKIFIDNLAPKDAGYPYFQTFYFVTKGNPSGKAKQFIDFCLSDPGIEIMKQKGMTPIN